MSAKNLLFLTHRWFGVVLSPLIALWFISGIIMMYVEYPQLTEAERLQMLPEMGPGSVRLNVAEALARSGIREDIAELRLSSVGGRPAYQITDAGGNLVVIFADNGAIFSGLESATALATVKSSGFYTADADPQYLGPINMNQWTVSSSLHRHRPLHKVVMNDPPGRVVYLSDSAGQIVRDTDRKERFWNWMGSTVHWIYPLQLRRHPIIWENLVILLAMAGLVSAITGVIIGSIRLHWRGLWSGKTISPYRGVGKWHHLLGLGYMLILSSFLFSGILSFAPWGLFDSTASLRQQLNAFHGGRLDELDAYPPLPPLAGIKEVEWLRIGGNPYLIISRSAAGREVISGAVSGSNSMPDWIREAAPRLIPDADIVDMQLLTGYDGYYYSRHGWYRPLPVFRVKFNDPEATWFDIDVASGKVILRHHEAGRLLRWLFNGLHSLDFPFLIRNGLLWDVTVIGLCLIGFGFSVTSVILGWRLIKPC